VRAALPQIVERKGQMVVISSVYAFMNGFGNSPYAVAKAGVEQLGRALRVELVRHGAGATVAYFGFIETEMVHRVFDEDPLGDRLVDSQPAFLMKRLPPSAAGRAIADGIERRAPRVVRPRRWTALSILRGILNPILDRAMTREGEIQDLVAELDGRGDEEQPTTA
jgi:NAD(P)-dependent dehydrogenase (short-subunit alcohol dehydrogenase family)